MGFSSLEYWSGLPFPSPGDLPDPGIEPWSPALQADCLPSEPPGKTVGPEAPRSREALLTGHLLASLVLQSSHLSLQEGNAMASM